MSAVLPSASDSLFDSNAEEIERLAQHDQTSWWIRGRRDLIATILKARMANAAPRMVGDLGCGAGGMFEALREFGNVIGVDVSPRAVALCQFKAYVGMVVGSLEQLPFRGESLDLAGMTDVLEHVENDERVIRECLRVLKPGGVLVITVPALQWLYGRHDRALGHFRRYSRDDLQRLLTRCGFQVERITYFNALLLPLVMLVRVVSTFRGRSEAQADPLTLPKPWNWLAYHAFSAERLLIKLLDIPLGLSLLCTVRRPGRGEPAPRTLAAVA